MRSPGPRTLLVVAAAVAMAAWTVPSTTSVASAATDERPYDRLELDPAAPPEPITEHQPGTADRYDLAGGCFVLYAPAAGAYVTSDAARFAATAGPVRTAEAFRFRAFDLGKYLLRSSDERFLAAEGGPAEELGGATRPHQERLPVNEDTDLPRSFDDDAPDLEEPELPRPDTRTGAVTGASEPSALAEWIVRDTAGGFTFHLPVDDRAEDDPGPSDVDGSAPVRGTLTADPDGTLTVADGAEPGPGATFRLEPASTPCADWPQIDLNVEGPVATGGNPVDEVRGYLDAHLHMMAFEFIGGRSRCGRPWHPYGVDQALVDCPDHEPGGYGAALEFALTGRPTHDTTGWPDFPYWPRYDSLTHEQVHYRWVERAWRGGLRMFTNLLVDNNSLCETWVYKEHSCNEMDGVRLQAQRLRELERYIDAQWGGPGEGWFRIVTDPFEARRAINEGRLAVVMGIEVSVLFDCGLWLDQPLCDAGDIDEELAAVHELGVRQMELANKFDNALTGVTGDNAATGVVVNLGNADDTGQFWKMETCPEDRHEHKHDKHQLNVNDDTGVTGQLLGRDAIFGAVLQVAGTSGAAPIYPEGPHCNVRGLSDLGHHLLDRMTERGMLFDPDHMSTRGREEALDHLQAEGYSGVVSSHSWADATVYERVLEMGGVVTPYAGDASGFLHKWRDTRGWADDRYLFGIGYGADTNGFGSQGAPRDPPPGQGVTYPFTGFGGTTIDRQVSGNQVYDINTDGVDHYGLYPDWIEDIRIQAGADGDTFIAEMQRGPEAYLHSWERALGIDNDACRDPRVEAASSVDARRLRRGTRYEDVLATLGQPHERRDGTFTYCLSDAAATVSYAEDGTVERISISDRRSPARAGDATGRGEVGHDHAAHDHHPEGQTELRTEPARSDGSTTSGAGLAILILAAGLGGTLFARVARRI